MNMRLVWAILLSAGLAACGGGGESTSTPIPVPAAPTLVPPVAKDGYVLLDAESTTDTTITGYNVYWSTTPGVTKSSTNKFAVGYSVPQAHTGLTNGTAYYYVVTAVNSGGESAASAQVSATPTAAAAVPDLFFDKQWHLSNTGQATANPSAPYNFAKYGEDMRVVGAWDAGFKGNGVRIAIVDDGIEIGHEDLASNMGANILSHNYLAAAPSSTDPSYNTDATYNAMGHGTSCAGIAAARDYNEVGGRGVAPRATLVGYNYTADQRLSNEGDAMSLNAPDVSISSNSWGATDGTGELSLRHDLWTKGIDKGITEGRGGKGIIYMWAAGNGRNGANRKPCPNWICSDNSNYDGQANYRKVMAVAAVNNNGLQSYYSESGANLWVAAPGGEWCVDNGGVTPYWHAITTVDRTGVPGENAGGSTGDYYNGNYTQCMNGTSSATPAAAGAVALMLSANPNLGWRDVRAILAITSRMNDQGTVTGNISDTGWMQNGGGYWFHHKYGFGVVDAEWAAKYAAGTMGSIRGTPGTPYVNLGPEATPKEYSSTFTTKKPIPDNDATGVYDDIVVTSSGIASIEWVEITFTATHPIIGDLNVSLTNVGSGMVSQLAVGHSCAETNYACTSTYSGWVFGSAAHYNENADATWRLTVKDVFSGTAANTGTFDSWKIKFYGH